MSGITYNCDPLVSDLTDKSFEERASTNFDHPDSLDTALLVQHIRDLKQGLAVDVPTYDFTSHIRTTITEKRTPRKIILVEGILIFTESELVKEFDIKVFVVSKISVVCSLQCVHTVRCEAECI